MKCSDQNIKIRINIVLRAIFMKGAILDIALRHALWYILVFVIIILIKYYIWVEKIKTKCNVGIHGNIKSWLWVEYIASTGVRIIIIIDNNYCHCCMLRNICQNNYHCFMLRNNEKQNLLFNFLSPLYKLRLRILINVFLEIIVILHSFFSPSHLKKVLINLSLAVWAVFKLAFLKGRNWGKRPFQNVDFCFCWNCFFWAWI